jgi:hypothetical protein
MLAYVDHMTHEAADTFYPGYAKAMTDIGWVRGWPPMTRASFDAPRPPLSNGANRATTHSRGSGRFVGKQEVIRLFPVSRNTARMSGHMPTSRY